MLRLSFVDALHIALAFGLVTTGLYFLYSISDIIVMFLSAFLFAIALDKPLDKLVSRGIKRNYAAVIIYATFFCIIIFLLYLLLPPLAQEFRDLTINLPRYIDNATISSESAGLIAHLSAISESLIRGSESITSLVFKVSGGFVTFLVVFFVSLFLNLTDNGVKQIFTSFTPMAHREYAIRLFSRIERKVGLWLWGKSVSSFFVGCFVFIGLFLMGIEYAVTFAIFAAFLNYIPFLGPFIASLFPIFLGLIISPAHAVGVAILYLSANSIENFILIPALMKHSINLNPVILIFVVLVGGNIAGILGILIAIPVAAILTLIFEEYTAVNQKKGQPLALN